MLKNRFTFLFIILFLYSCSLQHTINPEHYNYIQAKNQITTDYALINEIEHITIQRLDNKQISVSRAKNIDKVIKEINFELDLAKKLLEAGNYKGSIDISKKEYNNLQILYKSLMEIKRWKEYSSF